MKTAANNRRYRVVAKKVEDQKAAFARDVRDGLTASPKRLSCRYFYDNLGSRLFEAICDLPEYYLTRAEREILQARAPELAELLPHGLTLVELGSGNSEKTRLLIESFLHQHNSLRYVPIDISRKTLHESSRNLAKRYQQLEVVAVAAEYGDALAQLDRIAQRPRMITWLGSSIGNLNRQAAVEFLGQIRRCMTPADRLLVGIDLRKERAILEAAYDDAHGLTAAFNRNLLAHINRELGGHFDLRRFQHRAYYNERQGRVEIYLVSDVAQCVPIDTLDLEISFAAGEAIHTEDSYKYSLDEIRGLARRAGLTIHRQFFDQRRRFSLNLLK
jgi:dimethylhistidine N-methyltransferase